MAYFIFGECIDMEDVKNISITAKDKIETFIIYYNQKVEYLKKSNEISPGRIDDFNNWYNKSARYVLAEIKRSVKANADEERVSALMDMFVFIIDKSVIETDYERLIDNLYFIPEKIKCSLEKFGLIDKKQIFKDTISLSSPQSIKISWGFKVNYDYISGDPNLGSPVSQIKQRGNGGYDFRGIGNASGTIEKCGFAFCRV